MGTWSPTLYGNDDAADLRNRLKILVRLPGDGEALFARLTGEFPALGDADDDSHSAFVLAAADQFHSLGIACPSLFTTAQALITSGRDLAVNRALEMSEGDLRKRAKILNDLKVKWSTPHPKPRPRAVLAKPEPLFAEEGTCFAYPIDRRGESINGYFSAKAIAQEFKPHAWGAMAVLWAGHTEGYFAAALVARLKLPHKPKPDLDTVKASQIDWSAIRGTPKLGYRAVGLGTFARKHLSVMRMEPLGVLTLDRAKVAARFPEIDALPRSLATGLSNFTDYGPVDGVGGVAITPIPIAEFLA